MSGLRVRDKNGKDSLVHHINKAARHYPAFKAPPLVLLDDGPHVTMLVSLVQPVAIGNGW